MARREAEVELGPYRYTVVPQKIGRLRRELNKAFDSEVGDEAAEAVAEAVNSPDEARREDMVEQLGGQAHAVLGVFVPDLMPKHEWLGYATEAAMVADEYEDASDRSPDMDQIVEALQTCMKVNRIDLLKHLREVVGADFLKAMVQRVIVGYLTNTSSSLSLPPTADTPTTTQSATPPTSETPGSEETEDGGYDVLRVLPPIEESAA